MKNLPRVPYNPEYYKGYSYKKIDILSPQGSGEGVWCLLSPQDQIKYDDDKEFGLGCGILCNDSILFPTLKAGQIIPIKFNGDTRASILQEWLNSKPWEYLDNS